jgi:hypothetical protein
MNPRARAGYPVPWSITLWSIEVIVEAVSSDSTSTGRGAFFSSTVPFLSSTLRMYIGSLRIPRFANTPYAETSSSRFTSLLPSASDKFCPIGLRIPMRRA